MVPVVLFVDLWWTGTGSGGGFDAAFGAVGALELFDFHELIDKLTGVFFFARAVTFVTNDSSLDDFLMRS